MQIFATIVTNSDSIECWAGLFSHTVVLFSLFSPVYKFKGCCYESIKLIWEGLFCLMFFVKQKMDTKVTQPFSTNIGVFYILIVIFDEIFIILLGYLFQGRIEEGKLDV